MEAFARAREFGDIKALKAFHAQWYLDLVQDSARARYRRFRASSPSSPLISTDPAFHRFVGDEIGSTDDRLVETLAHAYRLIEQGDSDNEAALVILSYLYQFPSSPIVISGSSYSFARGDSSHATYYLSETWTIPLSNDTIPKRFVVEWFKSADGHWHLNQVR
jgi:hypothetical protein